MSEAYAVKRINQLKDDNAGLRKLLTLAGHRLALAEAVIEALKSAAGKSGGVEDARVLARQMNAVEWTKVYDCLAAYDKSKAEGE